MIGICQYCRENSDGYVKSIEKNGHAFVAQSPIYGWIIYLRGGRWHGHAEINYCPMCGRRLREDGQE